jgi:hypothetical protein
MIRHILILSLGLFGANAYSQSVPRDLWISNMETAVPAHFCQEGQYFRECFSVTARECEEMALSSTRICLDKWSEQIPMQLQQPQDGTRWGNQVGSCAGQTYEAALQEKRLSNARCNNPANWMGG